MASDDDGHRQYERYADLVFEGGGVKGIALVGAYSVLEERGFEPQNVAGTSAGAIVATLLGAGYTAAEIRDIILGFDFRGLMDTAWEDRVPLVNRSLSLLRDHGIYEGTRFLEEMRGYLQRKGVTTFADLVAPRYQDEPRYRYRAQVIAADLTERCMLVLPQDAERLGVEPDRFDVALAVRMSMSIPIFFEPVRFRNPRTGREHVIVDGGLLSNFPVWLFDVEGEPDWPTFGLRLMEEDPRRPVVECVTDQPVRPGRARAAIGYLRSLVQTMTEAHDRLYIEQADFARTIPIPTLGVRGTDFDLSRIKAMELFDAGRASAARFLDSWSFGGYIAAFRSATRYRRREEVAERIRLSATS